MRRITLVAATGALAGIAFGLPVASRWIFVAKGVTGSAETCVRVVTAVPTLTSLVLVCLVLAAVAAAARVWRVPPSSIVLASIALTTAGVALLVASHVTAAASEAQVSPLRLAVAVGLATLAVSAMLRVGPTYIPPILAAAAVAPAAQHLGFVSPDHYASAALGYESPMPFVEWLQLAVSAAVFGAIAGYAYALLSRSRLVPALMAGLGSGLALALLLSLLQTAAFFACMQTGHYLTATALAIVVPAALLGCAVALSAHRTDGARRGLVSPLAPISIVALIGLYCFVAARGANEFAQLTLLHRDFTYAYVHFSSDGTWRRTLDQTANPNRTWRCEQFLLRHRCSAYRPAAMLLAAESQLSLWNFDEAAATLRMLNRQYPRLDGYTSVLLAVADLAAGRPGTMLAPAPAETTFDRWRAGKGAQLAANAAERLGLPNRARGYRSAYLDYLLDEPRTSWTIQALQTTRDRMDAARAAEASGSPSRAESKVTVSVTAAGRAARGVRVALVQPAYDPAFPGDSRQFTSAWTLPAWNGFAAVTDKNGRAKLEHLPYGRYELVLALDFRTAPRDCVVASSVPAVTLDGREEKRVEVKLVSRVRTLSPAPGSTVSASPRLRWEPYPGAASYSIAVMALDGAPGSARRRYGVARGHTCWARAGIQPSTVALDPTGFVDGVRGLESGRNYMWVVYAHGSHGELLSSSEHYFELAADVFRVESRAASTAAIPQRRHQE